MTLKVQRVLPKGNEMKMLEKSSKSIRENWSIIVFFILTIGAAIVLQKYGSENLSSLGANLVAGFIGSAATVYGIDLLIKHRDERNLLPVRASSYEDVRIMTHWALDLWRTAYVASVGDSDPKSWRELLSQEYIEKIFLSLDVQKNANTLPPVNWMVYLTQNLEKINKHAEKILERHSSHLDPNVYRSVYSIVYNKYDYMNLIQIYDKSEGCPRPNNLWCYMAYIEDWFSAILFLHDWTVDTNIYLRKNKISNIHQPFLFSPLESNENPPARIDEIELNAQEEAFKLWQERKRNISPSK